MVSFMRLAVSLLPVLATVASATLDSSMKSAGKTYFGTCADRNTLSDPKIAAIIKSEFDAVTPENSMKWQSTQPSKGKFTLDDADYLVNWATTNNKKIRGHTLLWYRQLPSWVEAITDKTELTKVIEDHVTTLVKRYAGKIYAWDVVNEIFEDNGTYRHSVFYKVLGTDFVKIAFKAAHAADPKAKLYINDYNLDYPNKKLTSLVALAKDLVAQGVPIHGIGSQAHLIAGSDMIDHLDQPLATLASTGLEIALTELDIRIKMPSSAAKLATQKEDYQNSVGACMRMPKCVGVSVWGVSDKYSWIPTTFPGEGAALLWNENFTKKPAYDGALAGITRRRSV